MRVLVFLSQYQGLLESPCLSIRNSNHTIDKMGNLKLLLIKASISNKRYPYDEDAADDEHQDNAPNNDPNASIEEIISINHFLSKIKSPTFSHFEF